MVHGNVIKGDFREEAAFTPLEEPRSARMTGSNGNGAMEAEGRALDGPARSRSQRRLTLVELSVVIAIIAVLTACGILAGSSARLARG